MRFYFFIAVLFTAFSCNEGDQLTKQEVADNYSGDANVTDVYIVDTTGENIVKDTLPVIIETAKRIEN
ncbi:hypothetical protein [Portibacter marinus]|uniref:hypothetical protein n=1 Tax=Portibacter marinus TaxID=2898660 RepID=UPI001F369130|nr:hypothetical protein [Portibacter marinus]